jgi:hypothetical protein
VTFTWVVPKREVTAVPVSVAVALAELLELDDPLLEVLPDDEPVEPLLVEVEPEAPVVVDEVLLLAPGRLEAAMGW